MKIRFVTRSKELKNSRDWPSVRIGSCLVTFLNSVASSFGVGHFATSHTYGFKLWPGCVERATLRGIYPGPVRFRSRVRFCGMDRLHGAPRAT